jgi:hypothetical protein
MRRQSLPIISAAEPRQDSAPLEKQACLFSLLRSLDSLLVAFSGGADSAYLAWAAHQTLAERALAITALSASFSLHDRERIRRDTRIRKSAVRREQRRPLLPLQGRTLRSDGIDRR